MPIIDPCPCCQNYPCVRVKTPEYYSIDNMRNTYLPNIKNHQLGFQWRTNPPPYQPGSDWQRDCTNAVIDCLTSEGIVAWPGDAVGCVVQMIEAYAKQIPIAYNHISLIPIILKPSKIHGMGAFAGVDFVKDQYLTIYEGKILTNVEADLAYPLDDGHTMLMTLDSERVIDGKIGGNNTVYINHSCDPNCEAITDNDMVWIQAIKDIKAGDELFLDYSFEFDEEKNPALYVCKCGSSNCRGTMFTKN